ncbi:hypothetical protein [Primorskyibacter marinus]|uniref:hypothetical protein n=1 Tax=Primorskyibacter marinus TaxID=1977320 RepID=UPI000E30753E|nr:hypothetical protein [Primorskyibacter marinus]
MKPDRLAVWCLSVLVAAMLALALMQTGGPGMGRAEKRDFARLNDLTGLERFVVCVARKGGQDTLPPTLSPVAACPEDTPREDPFTGAPYRYERQSDTTFRLCARFEVPERLDYRASQLDNETGCITGLYERPAMQIE